MIVLDEGSFLFQKNWLKGELCKIEGIPKVTYQVKDERVFVFDLLLAHVSSGELLSRPFEEIVRQALPQSWITASEAVNQWGIIPVPYKKVEVDGCLAILHEPLNALLPTRYSSEAKDKFNEDLAKLLLGTPIEGKGEFVVEGQAMSLRKSLDPTLLPPRPTLRGIENMSFNLVPLNWMEDWFRPHTYLSILNYESGFEGL